MGAVETEKKKNRWGHSNDRYRISVYFERGDGEKKTQGDLKGI